MEYYGYNNYWFYTTDESFDYNGPFGTATHHETGYHGFEIDYELNLESLEGWGDFCDINDEVKTYEDFLKYLKDHYGEIQDSEEYNNFKRFDELIEEVEEIIKDKEAA